MSAESIACPLCGHRFEPQRHAGCPACPLGAGCGTVCCPACGYSTVDPSRSGLVRLGRRLFGRRLSAEGSGGKKRKNTAPSPAS